MSSDKTKGLFAYSGAVKTEDFQLGKLLDNEELGEITFNLDVHGRHIADHLPAVELKGLIASIDYSRYRYENITLVVRFKSCGRTLLTTARKLKVGTLDATFTSPFR